MLFLSINANWCARGTCYLSFCHHNFFLGMLLVGPDFLVLDSCCYAYLLFVQHPHLLILGILSILRMPHQKYTSALNYFAIYNVHCAYCIRISSTLCFRSSLSNTLFFIPCSPENI